jgi:hypothetical protein
MESGAIGFIGMVLTARVEGHNREMSCGTGQRYPGKGGVNMKRVHYGFWGLVLVLVCSLGITGSAAGSGPKNVNCEGEIQWEVVPDARVTQFDCSLGKHGGEPALIFKVGIENASTTAKRFRINIFLEDLDKGAGHLVPRKGKPPVLEPGKSETVKIPFIKLDRKSNKMLVVVKTISN